jgi:16S rRNA (guanine966-N2)-methyltransferase
MKGRRSDANAPPGDVRVIAGQWRGRKLPVPALPGLRPTSDRVRETLFNWLQGEVAGRRVLDLFAGTGALGFEAASRGAAAVVLCEAQAQAAAQLQASIERLHANQISLWRGDALALLASGAAPFDGVFLDPPFASAPWAALWQALPAVLAADAWVYVESPLATPAPLPPWLVVHREGQTREVLYRLCRRV